MIVNADLIVQYVIKIENGIIKHVNVNAKIIVSAKKIIVGIQIRSICENSKYSKSTSATKSEEILSAMVIISTKKTNFSSTPSINCHSIKVKDSYTLHTVLLVFAIIIQNNELKKVRIKNRTCYYFVDII